MIYFLQEDEPGRNRIKIGYTSNDDVMMRISSIKTSSPSVLRLVAITDGGVELESALHSLFADHRITGEWFSFSGDIERYIQTSCTPFVKPEKARTQQRIEGRTWIEFPKSGTKNPRRYAMRRQWAKDGDRWYKVSLGRVGEIPPLTEDQYIMLVGTKVQP